MGSTHWRIYEALPNVKVVALADVDPAKRAGDVSKVVGNSGGGDNSAPLDMTGVATYEDAFEMIAAASLDIIDICVPTPDHSKYAIAALKAGKNVFCEKPVCRNIEQMVELREAVKDAKGFFNVGMCVRAWPEYNHAKELIASGAVGKVKSALFRRLSPSVDGNAWENWYMTERRSGGAVLDLHLHDTDFVCHLFGRPDAVQSAGIRGLVSDNGIDHLITSYVYPDGKLVTCEGGWGAAKGVPFEMSFQIICEKGALKLDAAGYHLYWNCGKVETPDTGDATLPTGWHRELKYFTDCVRDNITPDRLVYPVLIPIQPSSVFNSLL
jgi:predicted dehydrogenase